MHQDSKGSDNKGNDKDNNNKDKGNEFNLELASSAIDSMLKEQAKSYEQFLGLNPQQIRLDMKIPPMNPPAGSVRSGFSIQTLPVEESGAMFLKPLNLFDQPTILKAIDNSTPKLPRK